MTLVVDASVAIAWLDFEEGEPAEAALTRVENEGAIVPSLWRLEIANVLRTAVRRKRIDEIFVTRSLARLERLRIVIDAETDRHAWGETRRLSKRHDHTLNDAAYLELAIRRELPLASRDDELLAAARAAGVETVTE